MHPSVDGVRGRALRAVMALVCTLGLSLGCSSTESPGGGTGNSNGDGGSGGTAATGGSGGAVGTGGVGGSDPPPPPAPTGVVFDSGTQTIISPEYELDVSVSGPVGKGQADSPQYMLDYYVPTRPER